MDRNPWDWTKDDIEKLMGQMESLKLEFKDSRLFDADHNKIIEELTKEISAFANTVGGVLIIGVSEKKEGKSRVADHIDNGVDIKTWYKERVQQLIESNLNPFLPGLRVQMISIDPVSKKSIIVIYVPEGNTAYQAYDKRYYGRSEFEAKALPDHEIRLRMFKGKSSSGNVILNKKRSKQMRANVNTHEFNSKAVQAEIDKFPNKNLKSNTYAFELAVINNGEIDITGFRLTILIRPSEISRYNNSVRTWRYFDGMDIEEGNYHFDFMNNIEKLSLKMYPQDAFSVGEIEVEIPSDHTLKQLEAIIEWKLFLSNRTPIYGTINLDDEFRETKIITQ